MVAMNQIQEKKSGKKKRKFPILVPDFEAIPKQRAAASLTSFFSAIAALDW